MTNYLSTNSCNESSGFVTLSIGDWSVQGVDIAVGNLMVYSAAAGINPSKVLAVSIDAGTNNKALLDDPAYLGLRYRSISGKSYLDNIGSFVSEAQKLFPGVLIHW